MSQEQLTKEAEPKKEMTSVDVIDLYTELEKLGIKIWVDGGWGVDALLEKQSRFHKDLDIALEQNDVSKLRELLGGRGFKETDRSNEWNFVMTDEHGHQIDFHAFIFDDNGNVTGGLMYPTESLTGAGTINGHPVRCISPEWMVKFHSGYELKEKDFGDVSALCEKFGIDIPEEYAHFKK